jgi:putative PIG3 family NAD(P)H quinone oxidoreductase
MTCRAVIIREPGNVDVLEVVDVAVEQLVPAQLGPHDVVVEVAAAGLNRADLLQRKGLYPAPPDAPQHIPGLEYAGTVVQVGSNTSDVELGQRVMGLVPGGAMATYVVVHEQETIPVPAAMSFERAACLCETYMTAYDAMFVQGGLKRDQWVLVHPATSGVGIASWQLAHALGAHAIGTSRSEQRIQKCLDAGLVHGIVVRNAEFRHRVLEYTSQQGAHVIVDMVGAPYWHENLGALAHRGTWMLLGFLGGFRVKADVEFSLNQIVTKRQRIMGSVLRTRSRDERIQLRNHFVREVMPLFESQKLQPVIDSTFSFNEIKQAHHKMEQGEHFGNIVLHW